ncbi:unnamed protein product [Amoebophrya sp. A120]|nr:unnamed protein product [Amoebophrya sp. A120]|eukprot:GSA120T00019744001.1
MEGVESGLETEVAKPSLSSSASSSSSAASLTSLAKHKQNINYRPALQAASASSSASIRKTSSARWNPGVDMLPPIPEEEEEDQECFAGRMDQNFLREKAHGGEAQDVEMGGCEVEVDEDGQDVEQNISARTDGAENKGPSKAGGSDGNTAKTDPEAIPKRKRIFQGWKRLGMSCGVRSSRYFPSDKDHRHELLLQAVEDTKKNYRAPEEGEQITVLEISDDGPGWGLFPVRFVQLCDVMVRLVAHFVFGCKFAANDSRRSPVEMLWAALWAPINGVALGEVKFSDLPPHANETLCQKKTSIAMHQLVDIEVMNTMCGGQVKWRATGYGANGKTVEGSISMDPIPHPTLSIPGASNGDDIVAADSPSSRSAKRRPTSLRRSSAPGRRIQGRRRRAPARIKRRSRTGPSPRLKSFSS